MIKPGRVHDCGVFGGCLRQQRNYTADARRRTPPNRPRIYRNPRDGARRLWLPIYANRLRPSRVQPRHRSGQSKSPRRGSHKGLSTQEAVQIAEQQKQKLIQDLDTEKAKVEETSDFVEQTGKDAVEEIKAEIGKAEAAKFANKQPVSKETRAIVAKHFKSAAHKLRAKKNKLNFEAPLHADPVAQASRETQNQLIDAQLLVYENVLSFLSTMEQPRLRRSNSFDNLLQDTYIRQGHIWNSSRIFHLPCTLG